MASYSLSHDVGVNSAPEGHPVEVQRWTLPGVSISRPVRHLQPSRQPTKEVLIALPTLDHGNSALADPVRPEPYHGAG